MDDGCVCRGNWRLILKEIEPVIDHQFTRERDGKVFTFFGLVHAIEDYYYGMYGDKELTLLSCVGSIEGHGYKRLVSAK